ncbi:hypothetical protein [Phytoactinopolyspora limicola]|uniref:hypothetical protein n=1 Tax=Phytoactinopolyspora limicola TaxID=2715536 RepID=UPI00140B6FD3|nr:hypothetical protein [Phytoactinopolyspora limicola]
MKRWYILGPAGGIAAGSIMVVLGVHVGRAVVIGLVVAGLLIWAPRHWPEGAHMAWPRAAQPARGGGSHQVSRLASRMSPSSRGARLPDTAVQHRLRTLAIRKLQRLGVSWSDPRVVGLLGADVHAALDGAAFVPDPATVERIVAALDRLDAGLTAGAGVDTPAHDEIAVPPGGAR